LRQRPPEPADSDYYGVEARDNMTLKIGGPGGIFSVEMALPRVEQNFKV